MRTLISILCLLPALCFSQGFGNFRTDQPFLAADTTVVDYSSLADVHWYWTFDEDPASSFVDSIQSLAFTVGGTGTVTPVTGVQTNCPFANTNYYYIFASEQAPLNFTNNPWTLSVWVKQSNFGQFVSVINGCWHSAVPALHDKWMINSRADTAGTQVWFCDTNASIHKITNDVAWVDITNRWLFFCIGYETNTHKGWAQVDAGPRLYTDEILGGLQNTSAAGYAGIIQVSGYRDSVPPASTSCLQGSVDEMGIWLRTLTETEVSLLFNSTNGIPLSTFYP